MFKRGIRRQIVLHYFFVVFLALLLVEVIFLFAIRAYYYDSIFGHIKNHVEVVTDFVGGRSDTEENVSQELLNTFKLDKTQYEILDDQGNVLINSTGFESDRRVQTSDLPQALAGDIGRWVGRETTTGEQVMAVSKKFQLSGENVYVIRYVTSLKGVNEKLFTITLLAALIGVAVLAVVFIFSVGLANSIVRPINNITQVSAQLAKGRFDKRVKGNYRYELGELASTLNYMAEEIVRTNQVKDDFISSISHELRTPLTSIKGWSETLNMGDYDPEETRVGMRIISKETERLIGLVEEILDFSKLQQNEMKLVMNRVNLREILQEIMLNVWAKGEQKQVHLKLEAEELPYFVQGDANRLKQVFLNIVDNAVKFSHENSWIFLTLQKENGFISVAVQDTGIGISEEHLAKVRDRFFQADHQHGGTGLGLAITQQIVELHHGEMVMQSELGVGTTVTVTLPAAEDEEPEEELSSYTEEGPEDEKEVI
ncbi:HAMP domain-containing sensor histidine kinase [Paenibacillus sp. JX-17]|uniref:histidine kinase n=1 Tax=Paenibacillus lacisoli TaxID=3064525 RepID=A0ABT9C6K1_9BACL|nr:HAMP domain-containing sensor histidine kinase [Paenibacillus sp. JX-17]MDO7904890.1 HAMP domain-containing sensor histidine kinase [Paenibacillus sp. JX-17]